METPTSGSSSPPSLISHLTLKSLSSIHFEVSCMSVKHLSDFTDQSVLLSLKEFVSEDPHAIFTHNWTGYTSVCTCFCESCCVKLGLQHRAMHISQARLIPPSSICQLLTFSLLQSSAPVISFAFSERDSMMASQQLPCDGDENCLLCGRKPAEDVKCSFCMQLADLPVTTPRGHSFCLKYFEKWVGQGKKTCAKCREHIPAKMASEPRINSTLVFAIRMARASKSTSVDAPRVIQYVHNEDLPDAAFTTERAKKPGKANAKSGKIFVTIPNDHLGPITAEYDPVRNMGELVGDSWEDRLACRLCGAHFPHVSGIAGLADFGAQSVVGYF